MSIPLSLSTNPVTFPVLMPGQASIDQQIGLWSTTGQAVNTTVSIVPGAYASAFSVYLSQQDIPAVALPGGAGPPQPQTPSANIGPQQPAGHNYYINVHCVAPEQPVPVAFGATLLVSWERGSSWAAGSLEIPLQGTTAQITGSVTTAQPIKLQPGDHKTVELELTYQSFDPTPLQVTISPQQFPAGLNFDPVNVTITPKSVPAGQNPKSPSGGVVTGPPGQVVVSKTVVPANLEVTFDPLATMFGNPTGYAHLSVSYLPSGFAPEPGVPIKFDLSALPIEVTISPAQPFVLIPGQPFAATLSVKTKGGDTTFAVDPSTLPHGLTLGFPSGGNAQTRIGEGTTASVPITLTAAFDKMSNQTQSATVKLNWSAYDGAVKNVLSFDVKVLPSVLKISSGKLDAHNFGTDLSGSATLTLYANGDETFAGEVGQLDGLDSQFAFMIGIPYVNAQNQKSMFTVAASAAVGGKWSVHKSDSLIVSLWPQLCSNSPQIKLSVTGIGTTIAEALAAMVGAEYVYYLALLVTVLSG